MALTGGGVRGSLVADSLAAGCWRRWRPALLMALLLAGCSWRTSARATIPGRAPRPPGDPGAAIDTHARDRPADPLLTSGLGAGTCAQHSPTGTLEAYAYGGRVARDGEPEVQS